MYKNLQNLGLKLRVWKFAGLARLQLQVDMHKCLVVEVLLSDYKKEEWIYITKLNDNDD
jgi:hypothetical protein